MDESPLQSDRSRDPLLQGLTIRLIAAGAAGASISATIAYSGALTFLPMVLEGSIAIGSGVLTMLALSPWRRLRALARYLAELRRFAQQLEAIVDGTRIAPLRELIVDCEHELGRISRAAHDLAVEALTSRSHARLVNRRMNETVRRETRRAIRDLERQAVTDPLTGLGNRRAMQARIEELLAATSSSDACMAVLAIDMDRFKDINDALGHEAGDQCLVFLAHLLKAALRRDDCAIRLGGDEFIVLMPNQCEQGAMAVARRLQDLFLQMPWSHASPPRPTLSMGLTLGYPRSTSEIDDLIRQADKALYQSKRNGRSRITSTKARA